VEKEGGRIPLVVLVFLEEILRLELDLRTREAEPMLPVNLDDGEVRVVLEVVFL